MPRLRNFDHSSQTNLFGFPSYSSQLLMQQEASLSAAGGMAQNGAQVDGNDNDNEEEYEDMVCSLF